MNADDTCLLTGGSLNVCDLTPLSPTERAAAAERILGLRPYWSDRAIAAATGLAPGTVAAIRTRSGHAQAATRIGRDGKVRPVSGAEGRRAAGHYLGINPDASLRAIAKAAGISVGTARDVRERLRRGEDPVPPRQRSARDRAGGQRLSAVPSPTRARTALAVLRNDPALRGAQAGRMLLRLLNDHAVVFDDGRHLANAVPAHCADLVADTARTCADALVRFADHIDRRHRILGQRR